MSLYFAAEAATILQWSRLSDCIGRKPVLLCGLLGTIISIILFGLSRSFWTLVFRYVFFGTDHLSGFSNDAVFYRIPILVDA